MEIIEEHIKKLEELSNDYYSLFCAMSTYNDLTKGVIKTFTCDRRDYEYCVTIGNQLSEYFTCLKSLDWNAFLNIISIYNEHVQRCILERFKDIFRISKKYDIDCIDDLLNIINEEWDKCHIKNEVFTTNIMRVLNSYTTKPKAYSFMSKSFSKIYFDMVNEDILNPMQPVGNSKEVVYTMLPVGKDFYEANYKVLQHPIDWQVIRNGCNPLLYLAFLIKDEGDYYYNVVTNALIKDCCVFDNMFRANVYSQPVASRTTYYWLNSRLSEYNLSLIKNYLITPDVFNHQLGLYQGHENDEGDSNIKELKEYAQQRKLVRENK